MKEHCRAGQRKELLQEIENIFDKEIRGKILEC